MRYRTACLGLAACLLLAALDAPGQPPRRQLGVAQGPESVFSDSPATIFSELEGASPTNTNGRVGNELVFWGYRLADGTEVFLVACAVIDSVDCEARERRVCLNGTQVLARNTSPGLVRELRCKSIATVGPGDTRPGCTDREASQALAVSLVTCS